jgi:hypothetical protein
MIIHMKYYAEWQYGGVMLQFESLYDVTSFIKTEMWVTVEGKSLYLWPNILNLCTAVCRSALNSRNILSIKRKFEIHVLGVCLNTFLKEYDLLVP